MHGKWSIRGEDESSTYQFTEESKNFKKLQNEKRHTCGYFTSSTGKDDRVSVTGLEGTLDMSQDSNMFYGNVASHNMCCWDSIQ